MIETVSVEAHYFAMPNAQEKLLPSTLLAEMRPEKVGERLRLLREAHDLTPAQISDMLGIERTYWSRFEGGKRTVSDPVAAILVDRFGVTLDFLILGKWDKLPLDLSEKLRAVSSKYRSSRLSPVIAALTARLRSLKFVLQ